METSFYLLQHNTEFFRIINKIFWKKISEKQLFLDHFKNFISLLHAAVCRGTLAWEICRLEHLKVCKSFLKYVILIQIFSQNCYEVMVDNIGDRVMLPEKK